MSIEPLRPVRKTPELTAMLENVAGRSTALEAQKCVNFPIGCGKLLKETKFATSFWATAKHIPGWDERDQTEGPFFKDEVSAREYQLSGLCQDCQDSFFGQEEEF
jgi:hypothetical protein